MLIPGCRCRNAPRRDGKTYAPAVLTAAMATEELLACVGQHDRPANPFKEGRVERSLQLTDLRRDGGLGQPELLGCAGVAVVASDCQEDTELVNGHECIIKNSLWKSKYFVFDFMYGRKETTGETRRPEPV
ncbi:MAG: hypothetical protein HW397_660 [Dehalococcoidia bacterium]|nr:hypothetical protein [Dehalococcoidia bacterium]